MIFTDTSAWVASVIEREVHHDAAGRFLAEHQPDLLTTDYVVDETLLEARGKFQRARTLGEELFGGALGTL